MKCLFLSKWHLRIQKQPMILLKLSSPFIFFLFFVEFDVLWTAQVWEMIFFKMVFYREHPVSSFDVHSLSQLECWHLPSQVKWGSSEWNLNNDRKYWYNMLKVSIFPASQKFFLLTVLWQSSFKSEFFSINWSFYEKCCFIICDVNWQCPHQQLLLFP